VLTSDHGRTDAIDHPEDAALQRDLQAALPAGAHLAQLFIGFGGWLGGHPNRVEKQGGVVLLASLAVPVTRACYELAVFCYSTRRFRPLYPNDY